MLLHVLPIELILRILETLDPQSLLNCRTLSHLFKSLIDETIVLQYRIALYSSGMVDGPPGQPSTSERLSLLRSYEASWKNLDWNAHTSIPVPDGTLWELYGNVWAHSRGDNAIVFIQLPSRLRGIPLRQWTLKLDFALRDFCMDPSQDLLLTIERVTNASLCRIRFLTLSTGEIHRSARDTASIEYTRAVPGNLHWSYSIRISGDYVGILFIFDDNDAGNELVVWNWKTGARNLSLTLVDMSSFMFLGDNFVLAAASPEDDLRPALLLYNLDQRPASSTEASDAILRFLFPLLRRNEGISNVFLTSDPSPGWSSSPGLQVPFQIPCDERVIAFNLRRFRRGVTHSQTFLMPVNTLLGYVSDLAVGGEGRDIEWEEWGLPYVERAPHQDRWTVYTCFVFGMRHVLPLAAIRGDRRVMIVRDLCPRRCRRASEEERDESNALHQAMGCEERRYPRSIVRCVPLPTSIKSSYLHLMISEDGIVVLENDVTGKNLLHLLTF